MEKPTAHQDRKFGLATRLVHSGEFGMPHGSVAVPEFSTASYVMPDLATHRKALSQGARAGSPPQAYFYSGSYNPTITALETKLASIESGAGALAFASGMSAITTSLLTIAAGGGHLIVSDKLFVNTRNWLKNSLPAYGCDVTVVDFLDVQQVEAAFKANTRAIYFEELSNPLLAVLDLEALIEVAHRHGALTIVDNTFATPILLRPLEYGADLVLHSATKYMSGHGRVRGGAVAARDIGLLDRIAVQRSLMGANISSHNAIGILDGLRTLEIRVNRASETTARLAMAAAHHDAVDQVNYPGLPSHQGHALAKRLMGSRYGGMLSFSLKDRSRKADVYQAFELFTRATSLGDTVSLVDPTDEPDVLRISTGMEDPDDLIADLKQALDAALL